MIKPIAIFGAGGLGREVLALIHSLPQWQVIGFFDDAIMKGKRINGIEVLGDRNTLLNWPDQIGVVLSMGLPARKREIRLFLKDASNLTYPTLIHPGAIVMNPERVEIGEGTILTAGCIVTTDVQLGKHVLINLRATIGHDTVIADYTSIMPGVNLAGAVRIGEAVLVGSGANIISEVTVGEGALIGAGSVVTRDIKPHATAVGIPARAIVKKS